MTTALPRRTRPIADGDRDAHKWPLRPNAVAPDGGRRQDGGAAVALLLVVAEQAGVTSRGALDSPWR
jgi:hypothetical protein